MIYSSSVHHVIELLDAEHSAMHTSLTITVSGMKIIHFNKDTKQTGIIESRESLSAYIKMVSVPSTAILLSTSAPFNV